MDTNLQLKYLALRNSLSDHRYTGYLGIESVELVEKMFSDVVSLTSSYNELQEKDKRSSNDLTLAQSQLFPLRKENARLARENHQLHIDAVKLSNANDGIISEQTLVTNRFRDELAEVKLLLKMRDDQIARKDQDMARLRDAYESLTGISTAAKSMMSTKRVLKMSSSLKPSSTVVLSSNSNDDAELSGNSDGELIATLRNQLDIANSALAASNAEVQRVKSILNSREQELIRITKTKLDSISESATVTKNEGGSAISNSTMMGRIDQLALVDSSNKRIIDQLNSQVDFLNEQLAFRENDILYAKQELAKHEALKLEHQHVLGVLERTKEEKTEMLGHIRNLERQIEEFSIAVDSVDIDTSSIGNSVTSTSSRGTSRSNARSTGGRGMPGMQSSKVNVGGSSNINQRVGSSSDRYSSGRQQSSSSARSSSRDRAQNSGADRSSSYAAQGTITRPRTASGASDRNSVRSNNSSSNNKALANENETVARDTSSSSEAFGDDRVSSENVNSSNVVLNNNALTAGESSFFGPDGAHNYDPISSTLTTPVATHHSHYNQLDNSSFSDAGFASMKQSSSVLVSKTEFILNEKVKRCEKEIRDLKEVFKTKEGEFSDLQRKYKDYEAKSSDLESVNSKLKEQIEKFKVKLTEEVEEKDSLSAKCSELMKNVQIFSIEKDQLTEKLSLTTSEYLSLRQKHSEVSFEYSKQGQRLVDSDSDKRNQTDVVEMIKSDLKKVQIEKTKLDFDFASTKSENENLKNLAADRLQTSNELQSKYNEKCKELIDLKRDLSMLKQQIHSKDDLESSENLLKARITKLQGDNSNLELKNEKLHTEIIQIRHEKDLMEVAVSTKINENTHNLNKQDLSQLEREIEKKNSSISELQRQSNTLDQEKSKAIAQVSMLKLSISSLQTQLDERERAMKTREDEIAQIKTDFRLLESRYRELDTNQSSTVDENTNLRRDLHKSSEKYSRLEKEFEDLRESLSFVQSERDRLDDETLDLKRKLDIINRKFISENNDNKQLSGDSEQWRDKCTELKELLRNMESQSKLQSHKMSKLILEKDDEIDKSKKLSIDNDLLKTRVRDLEKSLNSSHETLGVLDEDRDKLQGQLDETVEVLAAKSKEKAQMEVQLVQVRQIVDKLEAKITFLNNDSVSKQRQVGVLESRLSSLHDENQEIHRNHSMKVNELRNASNDLTLMTRENQALTSELASLAQERDSLHHKITEFVAIIGNIENEKRSLELERSDLIETYRNNLQEKKKIESDLMKVSEMKLKAGHSIQSFHSQIAEMKGVITAKENNEAVLMSEKISLRSQLQKLNDELVKKQREIETFESENKRLIQDSYGLRQANSMLNERLQFLMKRIESLTDSNKVISNKNTILETERESYARQLIMEKQKSTEMGQVIQVVRSQMADKDIQLQRARIELSSISHSGAIVSMGGTVGGGDQRSADGDSGGGRAGSKNED